MSRFFLILGIAIVTAIAEPGFLPHEGQPCLKA
jgi:hypothetical protein